MLLAALQIRHFIFFAHAFIFNARVKSLITGSSRELGSTPRWISLSVSPVNQLDGTQVMSMRLKKVWFPQFCTGTKVQNPRHANIIHNPR